MGWGVISNLRAFGRHAKTWWKVRSAGSRVEVGPGLHIGTGTRLWAPVSIRIGKQVYIGKDVHIEANCDIGDYCLIANRVAMVGRRDHDFRSVGVPVRFGTWIGMRDSNDHVLAEKVVVEPDVWLGFGAILLTGVRVGRGAIVAAGSVVTKDVPPYTLVAGSPARVVGLRFESAETQRQHEEAIERGQFEFSERGCQHWVVQPGGIELGRK